MVNVTYIEFDGTKHEVQVEVGNSLMKGAVYNGVPGIDAECGGACACATCHVYIEGEWFDRLPGAQDEESGMLEFANEPQERSRLSCQIKVTSDMDGLVVRMPEFQS
ncbi:2Fe-2S iron-sulfur cluster-binding protein [Paenalcaligenes niemegkensis]|uniref:2Fe-2S iron-sulfur cluster-binding protein n=1 Tax=Paenalcaligenes niemegkensis TaxID=2895469 RepID=UPI001EE89BB1|nr:2Fe-2S iron-sulfur cluster-binding protein [Paenalcaligenes niemegkensis]MCQ9616118.1 2Fe-2S iron-sulfur cluster-binding protein [Paenalcaligenes niemegkensis]